MKPFPREYLINVIALFFIFWSFGQTCLAQTTFSGKVLDKTNNEPLIGASVLINGSFIGTYTDVNGNFILETEASYPITLMCSYLGYERSEIEITQPQQNILFELISVPLLSNEIVIRAQLREEVLQEVPIAVSAFDQSFIQTAPEIDDPSDLVAYVPGLSGERYSSSGSTFTIRGINTNALGLSAESKVAIFHDGAYNGRVQTAARGFFDIESVEVLKGPQGTLFGRNATAGVINIYSKAPKFYTNVNIELKGGNFGQRGMEYVVNTPLSDKLAMRLAGKVETRDGLLKVTNQNNHELGKEEGVANRLSLLWRPQNGLKFQLKLEQQSTEGGGIPIKSTNTDYGASADIFERTVQLDAVPYNDNEYYTASLQTDWVIGNNTSINAITTFNKNTQDYFGDLDGLPVSILKIRNPNEFQNFMQEIRLNGTGNRTEWMIAGSYFSEKASFDVDFIADDAFMIPIFFGFTDPTYFGYCANNPGCREFNELAEQDIKSSSSAIYGNVSYKLSDLWEVTAGMRYTYDKKDFTSNMQLGNGAFHTIGFFNIQGPVGMTQVEDSWSGIQPKFSVKFEPRSNLMMYGSYNRGYLSGGINNLTGKLFNKETNDAFEIGLKSKLLDDRIKFNFSAYNISYHDLQVEILKVGLTEIENAAKLNSKGVEIESNFKLNNHLDLSINAAFNDASYEDFSIPDAFVPGQFTVFDGNRPDRNPATQLTAIAQYSAPLTGVGELLIRADYSYQSRQYFERSNDEELAQDGYGLVGLSLNLLGLSNGKFDVSLYGHNLFDEGYSVLSTRSFEGGYTIIPGLPRLIGAKLRINIK